MAEELQVVLRKSENLSFGFSLLGTVGLPHVIYDIMENSPAAECGEVSFCSCYFVYYILLIDVELLLLLLLVSVIY